MKMSVCTLPEGGSIKVGIGDSGRTFRRGDAIDLDEVAVPAKGDRPAQTWREALSEHVGSFADAPEELPQRADGDAGKEE